MSQEPADLLDVTANRSDLRFYDPLTKLVTKHKSDKGIVVSLFHLCSIHGQSPLVAARECTVLLRRLRSRHVDYEPINE